MKKLLLCGFAAIAFLLTSDLNAENVLLDDEITSTDYGSNGSSIDGVNGWSSTGSMIFDSTPTFGTSFRSATVDDALATHALVTPGATDTLLDVLFVGRFRRSTDPLLSYKTNISLDDGTRELLIGTNLGAANYLTGTGITGYTPVSDPFVDGVGHSYQRLRLTYDATTNAGSLFAAPDEGTDGVSFGLESLVATFTSNIDVSSLMSLTATSGDGSDRIQSIRVASDVAPVPEPASVGLGLICLVGLATRRRRR